MFVSGRGKRWVNCWLTQVGTLHRCDGGRGQHPLDLREHRAGQHAVRAARRPDPLPALGVRGSIADQLPPPVDHESGRHRTRRCSSATCTPAGSSSTRSRYPGTGKVALINSPGHGSPEHAGAVAILDNPRNPDDRSAMRNISGRGYRDPWPLSRGLHHRRGGTEPGRDDTAPERRRIFFRAATNVHEPRPLIRRQREHVIPSRVDLAQADRQADPERCLQGPQHGGRREG